MHSKVENYRIGSAKGGCSAYPLEEWGLLFLGEVEAVVEIKKLVHFILNCSWLRVALKGSRGPKCCFGDLGWCSVRASNPGVLKGTGVRFSLWSVVFWSINLLLKFKLNAARHKYEDEALRHAPRNAQQLHQPATLGPDQGHRGHQWLRRWPYPALLDESRYGSDRNWPSHDRNPSDCARVQSCPAPVILSNSPPKIPNLKAALYFKPAVEAGPLRHQERLDEHDKGHWPGLQVDQRQKWAEWELLDR